MEKNEKATPAGRAAAGSASAGPTPDLVKAVRQRLLAAYDEDKRNLPWRGEKDPYRIWVSEVMLQQTRVETVIPYYKKWMERFPRLGLLAEATEEQVLKAWQGLGYYSRARRLLGAARVVEERYRGELPDSAAALRNLPGVGEYTSGAVASIAFGEVVPAVDGNVRRVLSRLFDLPDPGPTRLRDLAGALVDPARPGDFNQALMELGATLCLPRSPRCPACPLQGVCLARSRGTEGERPTRRKRGPVPEVRVAVLAAVQGWEGGRVESRRDSPGPVPELARLRILLRKRPEVGLLAGMWELPGVEVEEGRNPRDQAASLLEVLGQGALGPPLELPAVVHLFSHLKATYLPFLIHVAGTREPTEGTWFSPPEITDLPLPVAQRRILETSLGVLQEGPTGGSLGPEWIG